MVHGIMNAENLLSASWRIKNTGGANQEKQLRGGEGQKIHAQDQAEGARPPPPLFCLASQSRPLRH